MRSKRAWSIDDLGLLGGDVLQHAVVVALGGLERERGLGEVGLGGLQGDAELPVVEAEQDVPLLTTWPSWTGISAMMPETSVASGELVGADIGVVDGDVAAAVQPEVAGADGDGGDAAEHEQRAEQARAAAGGRGLRRRWDVAGGDACDIRRPPPARCGGTRLRACGGGRR